MKEIREFFSILIILIIFLTFAKAANTTRCRTFTQQCNKISKCCEGLLCKKLPNHYRMCFRDPKYETTTEASDHFEDTLYSSEVEHEGDVNQNDTNIEIYGNSVKENGNIILNQEEIVFRSKNQNRTGSEDELFLDELENSQINQDNEFEVSDSQNNMNGLEIRQESKIIDFNERPADSQISDFEIEISQNSKPPINKPESKINKGEIEPEFSDFEVQNREIRKPESKINKIQAEQTKFSDIEIENPPSAEKSKTKFKDSRIDLHDNIEIEHSSDFKIENLSSSGKSKSDSDIKDNYSQFKVNSANDKKSQAEDAYSFEHDDLHKKIQDLENHSESKSIEKSHDQNYDTIHDFALEKPKSISISKIENSETEEKVPDIDKDDLRLQTKVHDIEIDSKNKFIKKEKTKNSDYEIKGSHSSEFQEYGNMHDNDHEIKSENSKLLLKTNKPKSKINYKSKGDDFEIDKTHSKIHELEYENLHSKNYENESKNSKLPLKIKINKPKTESENFKSKDSDFEMDKSHMKSQELDHEDLRSKDQEIAFENSNLPLEMNHNSEVKDLKTKAKINDYEMESPLVQIKKDPSKPKIDELESIFSEAGSITSV